MRYFSIFFHHFQEVFEDRSRLVVWLLLTCVNPLVLILFWRGSKGIAGWTIPQIASYYFLIIILSAFLMPHHEDSIADDDIKEGRLTAYLLKPFPYYWQKLFTECSYRILQGTLGVIVLFIVVRLFPNLFVFTNSLQIFLLSSIVAIVAFFLAFTFKSLIGFMAFWMTDAHGLFEANEVVLWVTSGLLMPIAFFPHWLASLAFSLPFAYMIYFPILAFEGKLSLAALLQILGIQLVWLSVLVLLYQILWRLGIKKYTGVGQ